MVAEKAVVLAGRPRLRHRQLLLVSRAAAPIERIAAELGVAIMTVKLWRRRYAAAGLAGLADAPAARAPARPTPARTATGSWRSRWARRPRARPTGASGAMAAPDGHEPLDGPPHLGGARLQAPPDRDVQVQHRPGPRGQGPRRRRALPRPARRAPSCCRSTRRPRSRRSTAPSRCCRCARARSSGTPTTTRATARPACSRRSRWARAGSPPTTRDRHTGADFLAFMRRVARAYPDGELHVVLDNVSHPQDARPSGPGSSGIPGSPSTSRPTSASWMNQVETWFGILTRQAIRRGSFRLGQGARRHDRRLHPRSGTTGSSPFVWVKTADEILAKAVRKPRATSESGH